MPEQTKRQPKGAPELPDETKKTLEDEGDISKQKHSEPENLPEVMEPSIADQEANLGDEELEDAAADQPEDGKKHRLRNFFADFWHHKKWTLPLSLLVIVGILLAVPATRYPMLGTFMSSTYKVEIVDSKTGTPVSGATVAIGAKSALTDEKGRAEIKSHVGKRELTVSKKYYTSTTSHVLVGLKSHRSAVHVELVATGRQVPLKVVDRLSGKAIKNAEIKVLDTSARTDATGQAIIVLPTKNVTEKATITASGYNQTNANVHITDKVVSENTVSLVPAGRVYFLSNKSGNVDVVSTNFDGTARATVATGTGNEDTSTRLFVSPDQKHLALFAKRDDSKAAKLYVIDTGTNDLSLMDPTASSFDPTGWVENNFVYTTTSLTLEEWQPHQIALKSFDASSNRIVTLDQTRAKGKQSDYARQNVSFVKSVGDHIVYGLSWATAGFYGTSTTSLAKELNTVISMHADGSDRRTLKSTKLTASDRFTYFDAMQPSPQVLYVRHTTESASVFYIYQDGNITQTNAVNNDLFYKQRPTYFVSPNGTRTFWTENRDGQAVLFTGDAKADNSKQIATLDDVAAYGWDTDKYLLVSKTNSQLFILPASGLAKDRQPMKVSDYYNTTRSMQGF